MNHNLVQFLHLPASIVVDCGRNSSDLGNFFGHTHTHTKRERTKWRRAREKNSQIQRNSKISAAQKKWTNPRQQIDWLRWRVRVLIKVSVAMVSLCWWKSSWWDARSDRKWQWTRQKENWLTRSRYTPIYIYLTKWSETHHQNQPKKSMKILWRTGGFTRLTVAMSKKTHHTTPTKKSARERE